MSMFVAVHQHSSETCPAANREMAPMLLQHLAPANASKFGVKVLAEAVLDGQHTLHLIVEAPNREKVQEFMAPFAQAGSVAVHAASPCEKVVSQGRC